jgi:hypothetical protein
MSTSPRTAATPTMAAGLSCLGALKCTGAGALAARGAAVVVMTTGRRLAAAWWDVRRDAAAGRSALRVARPTMPSTSRWCARWTRRTAAMVRGPNRPSTPDRPR